MGVLYESVKKANLHQEMKRNFVIKKLQELGVQEYQGISIYDLDYQELLPVLVLAEMRQVDIEHPNHRWFR
jgi:hypothetical protein